MLKLYLERLAVLDRQIQTLDTLVAGELKKHEEAVIRIAQTGLQRGHLGHRPAPNPKSPHSPNPICIPPNSLSPKDFPAQSAFSRI